MAEKLPRHDMMNGGPLTWGPNEKGQYLGGGTCRNCGEQVLGKYKRAKLQPEDVSDNRGEEYHQARVSRLAAVTELHKAFDKHGCA
jgi:hypothetical protein